MVARTNRSTTLPHIQLICIDVDGTLVGSGGRIHPAVWPAAARATAAGVRLSLSSGRPAFGIARELAARLDPDGWHCFQNGASVVHLPGNRSRSTPLPPGAAAGLITRARAQRRGLELYTDDDYAVELDTPRARAHADLLGVPFRTRPFESLDAPVVRAQWVVPATDLERVMAEPHPGLELLPSTATSMPDTRFINMTRAGVDKGTATAAIAAEYGIPLEHVMFVGDGWNDVAALQRVGHPVVMGNAEPAAMKVAKHVVAHVDDGGLAEALDLALDAG